MKRKHYISTLLMICSWFFFLGVSSCTDDGIYFDEFSPDDLTSRAAESIFDGDGLTLLDDGTYLANRRVPLVGQGRIIDNMMNSLITVGATESRADNIVDLDLTNTAIPQANAIGAEVTYNAIVSVRDINYVYAGQKAGYVIKLGDQGLATLELVKGFTLATYLRGELQEENAVTTASGLLSLDLGKISSDDGALAQPQTLEADFTKPFDEIRLNTHGVNVNAGVVGLEVYYAFVGETPIIMAINDGNEYFNNGCSGKFDNVNNNQLVDANISNGPAITIINNGTFEVDFGREIPANTEVGFYLTNGKLLSLDLGQTTTVETLDENGRTLDSMTTASILSIGLASGGEYRYSLITSQPCYKAKLTITGLLIIGATVCHYAYIREEVKPDISSYFTLANATVYTPGYQFPNVKKGSVTYRLVSQPSGANASIDNNKGILWNMNVPGNYVVEAVYIDEYGVEHTERAIITRKVRVDSDCNNKLINTDPDQDIYEAYIPNGWTGIGIPIEFNEGELSNITDSDSENYFTINSGFNLTLANDKGLVGVKRTDGGYISNGRPMRVGFVVNNEQQFLNANVLNFFRIKLLKDGVEVGSKPADGAVQVSLIKSLSNPLTRLSMLVEDTELEFDAIEMFYSGVADVSLAHTLQIYYAFVDYDLDNCPDPGQECMQLITNGSYSAVASFDVKGLATVGVTVTNLGNIVDGRLDSYATVVKPVSAGTETRITTRFDPIPGGTAIGFVLLSQIDVVKLIDVLILEAYAENNDETPVIKASTGGALNVTLGSDKYKYLYVTPPVGQNITRLDLVIGDGLDLGTGLDICGIFSRPDLDGNGLYDCLDDEASANIQLVKLHTKDLCIGDLPEIEIEGGEDNRHYQLTFTKSEEQSTSFDVLIGDDGFIVPTNEEEFNKFFENPANCGIYTVNISGSDGESVSADNLMELHPLQTAWNGSKSTDWTDWDNWDYGEPWSCTDVVIPSPTLVKYGNYPVLENGKKYYCKNIHFEPGGLLTGQSNLTYSGKAYVDYTFDTNDYMLMSTPLQGMVTGDMFVPQNGWTLISGWNGDGKWQSFDNFFTPLTENNYIEKRVSPIIYQRFWDEEVTNVTMTRASNLLLNSDFNDWSRSFNAVSTLYELGQGFAIRVQSNEPKVTMHFPKSHMEYQYYDANGNPLNKIEVIARGNKAGKLWDGNLNIISLNRMSSGNVFLFGNPFMSKIKIGELKNVNPRIKSIQKYANNQYSEMEDNEFIMPMQAVFLITETDAESLDVAINSSVFPQASN